MKILNILILGMLSVFFTTTISPADVNGRLVIKESANSRLAVLVQINTNTGTDALGGATMVLGIDTSSLSFKTNPVKNQDYIFHNFSDYHYSAGTVTHPLTGKIWINIDLPFIQSNNGDLVSDSSGWTEVLTIYLDIKDPNTASNILWLTDSPFWGIYGDDNYTIWNTGQFQNLENFSPLTGLSLFNAVLINNNQILLSWLMMSDDHLYGFDIEKSQNSKVKDQNEWEKIGFVESMGNSNTMFEYSFTDVTPHYSSIISYRLKMIDNDGTFTYSNVIEVDAGPLSFELKQNYPNPFNPATMIGYQLQVNDYVSLKVYDVLGNEVATLVDGFVEAGYHTIEYNAFGISSGVYIYRLMSGSRVETKKMVLLR